MAGCSGFGQGCACGRAGLWPAQSSHELVSRPDVCQVREQIGGRNQHERDPCYPGQHKWSDGQSELGYEMADFAEEFGTNGDGRGDWIRTSDLFVPNEARYQTAPRPDRGPEYDASGAWAQGAFRAADRLRARAGRRSGPVGALSALAGLDEPVQGRFSKTVDGELPVGFLEDRGPRYEDVRPG